MHATRRRFLAIASAMVGYNFIPSATHGEIAEIVGSEPDRYKIIAAAFKKALDVPTGFGAIYGDMHRAHRPHTQAYDRQSEEHRAFLRLYNEAMGTLLELFPDLPTYEQVAALINTGAYKVTLEEGVLRSISPNVLPVSILKGAIADMRLPLEPRHMKNFEVSSLRYRPLIMAA